MKISFDLDDTLIPSNENSFPTEKRTVFQKLLGVELLRRGSRKLFSELQAKGHEVGIYTTSFRTRLWIKFQFLTYGININFVINQVLNQKREDMRSSKLPTYFGVDLHIDDLEGVGIEGKEHGYLTIIIKKEEDLTSLIDRITTSPPEFNINSSESHKL